MAKKATKKKTVKKGDRETVIVGSKVKAAIKENGCMTSGEFLEAFNDAVHDLLDRACERASENGRSTVRARDI